MSSERPMAPLYVWRHDPLVIGAPIADDESAERVASALAAGYPARTFITVVAARDAAMLGRILTSSLRQHLAEMIFTTPTSGAGIDASSAAFLALDQFGVGQDHVFSVESLADALPYTVGVLQRDQERWDGDAIVVLAAADDLEHARASLDTMTG